MLYSGPKEYNMVVVENVKIGERRSYVIKVKCAQAAVICGNIRSRTQRRND